MRTLTKLLSTAILALTLNCPAQTHYQKEGVIRTTPIDKNLGQTISGTQIHYNYRTATRNFQTEDTKQGIEWYLPEISKEGYEIHKPIPSEYEDQISEEYTKNTNNLVFEINPFKEFNVRSNGQIILGDNQPDMYLDYGRTVYDRESVGCIALVCDKEFKELYDLWNIQAYFGIDKPSERPYEDGGRIGTGSWNSWENLGGIYRKKFRLKTENEIKGISSEYEYRLGTKIHMPYLALTKIEGPYMRMESPHILTKDKDFRKGLVITGYTAKENKISFFGKLPNSLPNEKPDFLLMSFGYPNQKQILENAQKRLEKRFPPEEVKKRMMERLEKQKRREDKEFEKFKEEHLRMKAELMKSEKKGKSDSEKEFENQMERYKKILGKSDSEK